MNIELVQPARRGKALNLFRLLACLLPFAGTPGFLFCARHFSGGGHLVHPPYPEWYMLSDYFWLGCFAGAAILAVCSGLPLRYYLASALGFLAIHRLLLTGGFGLAFDVLWLVVVYAICIRGLARRRPVKLSPSAAQP